MLRAEVNAELDRRTRSDTTAEHAKPMRARGAHAFDRLGPTSDELAE